jgi:hypothetical protein
MAGHITDTPLAAGGIYRDFEADVLERMQKHGAKLHGCPVYAVQCKNDGGIAFRFKGPRDGYGQWEGGMKMSLAQIENAHAFGDPNAVTECALQILATIGANAAVPTLVRGNPN